MIRVENLYKSFEDNLILNDVNVAFEPSQVNLIIGASGSGKTVLIKCLLGLFPFEAGKICFNNISLSEASPSQLAELRTNIGVVFQANALFDSYSVVENVEFPLQMFSSLTKKEIREKSLHVLEQVNLHHSAYKHVNELSGGMQKRLAIARAIVNEPDYLFLDEPNSGLDPNTAKVIDELVCEITQRYNMLTIINTHDMNSVFEIGDHILFLKNGENTWEGTRKEVLKTENTALNDFVFSSEWLKKAKS